MKRLAIFLFLFSGVLLRAQSDSYGGWTVVNSGSHPARQSIVSASQTGTVKTITVTSGAAFAPNEPMCEGGTSSALDYVYDGTKVNAGADKITNIAGNVLTMTANVSHSVPGPVTTGWIEPCKFYVATMSGSPGPVGNGPKLMTPAFHDFFWAQEIGGADYSTGTIATALLTSRYGGLACNAAADDTAAVLTFNFNAWGMDSNELFPTGGGGPSCPSLTKLPFAPETFSSGYSMTNVFGYASQPTKNMDEAIITSGGGYATNCPVRRGQADTFDPHYQTFINAFFSTDTSVLAYMQSPFDDYIKSDDVGIDGVVFSGSAGDFPTLPRGHNDCDATVLVAITSPIQAAANDSCCYGNPAPPFLYPDPVVYSKKLSAVAPGSCTVASPCSLPDFARNTYGTVSAMNAAFGSNYTSFDTTGSTFTGEVLASGNGSTLTFSGTLANGPISPFSLQIFVGAAQVAGGIPSYARGSGGNNLFVGPNIASGTFNTTTKTWSVTFTAGHAPASGTNNITMNYVTGGWPVSVNGGTGLPDEDGTNSWVPTQPICVFKPLAWAANTVFPPDALVAISNTSWQRTILGGLSGGTQPTWSTALGNPPVTGADGTIAWLSQGKPVCAASGGDFSPAPNGNANYVTFLNNFMTQFAAEYFMVNSTAIKTVAPHQLYGGTDGLGDYWTPPRPGVMVAMQQWADLGEPDGALDTTQNGLANVEMAHELLAYDRPLLGYTNIYSNDASLPTPGVGYPVFATQTARMAYVKALVQYYEGYSAPSSAMAPNRNPFTGWMQWFMGDTQGNNGGLKTTGTTSGGATSGQGYNFYDSNEDTNLTVNCSPPNGSLTNCGGESGAANFLGQDGISQVTQANALWNTSSVTPGSTPASTPSAAIIARLRWPIPRHVSPGVPLADMPLLY